MRLSFYNQPTTITRVFCIIYRNTTVRSCLHAPCRSGVGIRNEYYIIFVFGPCNYTQKAYIYSVFPGCNYYTVGISRDTHKHINIYLQFTTYV